MNGSDIVMFILAVISVGFLMGMLIKWLRGDL